jgi:hypothetical protein
VGCEQDDRTAGGAASGPGSVEPILATPKDNVVTMHSALAKGDREAYLSTWKAALFVDELGKSFKVQFPKPAEIHVPSRRIRSSRPPGDTGKK